MSLRNKHLFHTLNSVQLSLNRQLVQNSSNVKRKIQYFWGKKKLGRKQVSQQNFWGDGTLFVRVMKARLNVVRVRLSVSSVGIIK